jgi:hypothetical protein
VSVSAIHSFELVVTLGTKFTHGDQTSAVLPEFSNENCRKDVGVFDTVSTP